MVNDGYEWYSTFERLKIFFGEFRRVRKKVIAKERASRPRRKPYSSKAPFMLPGFIRVCSSALDVNEMSRMFIWTFMVLALNLCARSVNVAWLRWSSMSLSGDCIRIHFDCTKTMQGGEAARHPKHIFANGYEREL